MQPGQDVREEPIPEQCRQRERNGRTGALFLGPVGRVGGPSAPAARRKRRRGIARIHECPRPTASDGVRPGARRRRGLRKVRWRRSAFRSLAIVGYSRQGRGCRRNRPAQLAHRGPDLRSTSFTGSNDRPKRCRTSSSGVAAQLASPTPSFVVEAVAKPTWSYPAEAGLPPADWRFGKGPRSPARGTQPGDPIPAASIPAVWWQPAAQSDPEPTLSFGVPPKLGVECREPEKLQNLQAGDRVRHDVAGHTADPAKPSIRRIRGRPRGAQAPQRRVGRSSPSQPRGPSAPRRGRCGPVVHRFERC